MGWEGRESLDNTHANNRDRSKLLGGINSATIYGMKALEKIGQTMDKYTYRVTWSEEDNEYVGLCAEFPSLSWLAKTQEQALTGVRTVVAEVTQEMKSAGEHVPEPLATKHYSGKFTVRVPPDVHRKLQIQAAEAKVSVNRLVSSKLSQ
jgi:predicted HicB family RNase H-like nuclease